MRRKIRLFIIVLIVFIFGLLAYWETTLSKKLSSNLSKQYKYNYLGLFQGNKKADKINAPKAVIGGKQVNLTQFRDPSGVKLQRPKPSNKTQNGLHIMILARMRTGSTLIGEIFNQNPSLYYLFEPLHAIDCYIRRQMMIEEDRMFRSQFLLRNINKCHFTHSYVECVMAWGLGRYKSNVLRQMCESSRRCAGVTQNTLSQQCRQYDNHFAMKFIRADLGMIKPLVTQEGMNVKVIHLVRDPRGTANSRKTYYNDMLNAHGSGRFFAQRQPKTRSMKELGLLENEKPKLPYKVNTLESLCQWMRDTVGMATDRPEWLKGRYKMVRYEDMAQDPIRITRDIYDFVGLDLTDHIIHWVEQNTNTTNNQTFQTFSTHKNSTATATSWRRFLDIGEVQQVQNMCGDVMSLLGYTQIERAEDLRNPDVPVTKPLKLGADITLT